MYLFLKLVSSWWTREMFEKLNALWAKGKFHCLSIMGWNTNWNNCWRIKGSQKEQNQYCWRWIFLFWTWAKGFRVPKRSVDAALPEELWSHQWHYAHFLLQNPLRVMLKTYLEEKIYREGDMDILLNALANAYYCKFILHQ